VSFNPPGEQKPSRFKLLLGLFIFFAILVFMFAILSQPIGILVGVLDSAYPSGENFTEGRNANTGVGVVVELALGAAVIVGLAFLIFFYGFKNLGGGNKDAFG